MSFYKIALGAVKGVLKVVFFFKEKGRENIPTDGAFLLCANHRSFIDPLYLATGCRRQLTFMAKDSLFEVPVLGRIIKSLGAFPIKRGKGDAAAVMATLKILKKGGATLIFPEGKRIKDNSRPQVNSGIIRLAIQSNVPIVPAFVGKRIVSYGEPIYYSEYSEYVKDAEKMQFLADSLMDTIYSLGDKK